MYPWKSLHELPVQKYCTVKALHLLRDALPMHTNLFLKIPGQHVASTSDAMMLSPNGSLSLFSTMCLVHRWEKEEKSVRLRCVIYANGKVAWQFYQLVVQYHGAHVIFCAQHRKVALHQSIVRRPDICCNESEQLALQLHNMGSLLQAKTRVKIPSS